MGLGRADAVFGCYVISGAIFVRLLLVHSDLIRRTRAVSPLAEVRDDAKAD